MLVFYKNHCVLFVCDVVHLRSSSNWLRLFEETPTTCARCYKKLWVGLLFGVASAENRAHSGFGSGQQR